MNISGIENIAALLGKYQNRSGRNNRREHNDEGFIQHRGLERARQALDNARGRREARRNHSPAEDNDPPVSIEPVEEETPSSTTTSPTASESLTIDDLAELYVQQYEDGSGKKLSEEEFSQKKTEVANFYSGFSDGKERLDRVVFANDGDSSVVA